MRRLVFVLLALCCAASAFGANQYEIAALAEARKQSLSSEAVADKPYAEIAALAGVTLGAKGESPATFFYVHVRRHVVHVLAAEEKAARVAARQSELQAKVREAFPGAEIVVSEDGSTWKIEKVTVDPNATAEAGGAALAGTIGGAALIAMGVGLWLAGHRRRRRHA